MTAKTAEERCRGGGGASGVPRSARLAFLTVSLLSAAVAVRSADPFDRVDGPLLAAAADRFRDDWPATEARSGQVKIQLWPDGEPSSWSSSGDAVCGYQFSAEAAAVDGARTGHLPEAAAFLCGDGDRDEYRVGVPAAENASDAAYATVASLGEGAHAGTVRLETAGETAVPLTLLCFGFVEHDGGGGGGATRRAFCADVELLTACRRWTGSPDLDFGLARVQLKARRRFSCREIVFSDVRALARGFESLARNTADEAARRDVCQRIRFNAAESRTHEGCLGRRVSDDGGGDATAAAVREFKFTRRGLLVDAADESYACERTAAKSGDDDDDDSHSRTSGGRTLHAASSGFSFLFSFTPVVMMIIRNVGATKRLSLVH